MGLFELSILIFVVFLILGPKRITNLFRALGRGVKDFKTEFGSRQSKELPAEDDEPGNEPRKK